jgi:hypothetical protein
MRYFAGACLIAAVTLAHQSHAGGVTHHYDRERVNLVTSPYSELKEEKLGIEGFVAVGEAFQFSGTLTVCQSETDFDEIIDAELRGADAVTVFNQKGGCDTVIMPPLTVMEKLRNFRTHDGVNLWLIRAEDLGGQNSFYVAIPAEWFKDP